MRHEPLMRQGRKSENGAVSRTFANSWHKRINNNIAFALLASVMWHLTLIPRYLPDLGLIPLYTLWIFVGLILVPARMLDLRWDMLDPDQYSNVELQKRFRLDQAKIWLAAFFLPYVWVQALAIAAAQAGHGLELGVPQLISFSSTELLGAA